MFQLLDKQHNRIDFDCGNELLNTYLKNQALQDVKRKLSACFVLNSDDSNSLIGYYTLSNTSIPLIDFPEQIQKKLPKSYYAIPATLLGRLAINNKFKGKGMGKMLLLDALKRSFIVAQEIGSFAIVVDPIDEDAERFYRKYDFEKLPSSGKMFITIATLKLLFQP